MTLFVLTALVIGVAMLVMGVGVLFNYRCLRGSCGSPDAVDPDGEPLSCAACPRRKLREITRYTTLNPTEKGL